MMPESRGGVLREIAWLEICPWLILVRTIRLAIQLRMLLLSSAAVLLAILGWWVFGYVFGGGAKDIDGNPTRLGGWIAAYENCPFTESEKATDLLAGLPSSPQDITLPTTGVAPVMGDYPRVPFLGPW